MLSAKMYMGRERLDEVGGRELGWKRDWREVG